jgi:hypothetical protein
VLAVCADRELIPERGLATEPEVDETERMANETEQVAGLLHEAGETHHRVYRIVDGDDPDWASWYADWLINLSELPQILGAKPVRSELVWLLVGLDKDYAAQSPDAPWPQWYAERVVAHFG